MAVLIILMNAAQQVLIQIGLKTFKDYKQYAKWVCEVETFDEKFFEKEF